MVKLTEYEQKMLDGEFHGVTYDIFKIPSHKKRVFMDSDYIVLFEKYGRLSDVE